MNLRRWFSRDHVYVTAPAILLIVGAFVLAWAFMKPAPPRHFVIATGRPDGAYYQVALQYRDALARDGITVEVRPTAGSIENVRLLEDAASGVEVAFVQGGVLAGAPAPGLVSLGTLYIEPLWLFARAPLRSQDLSGLAGKRIAVGPPGSGTRALAEKLLQANGLTATSAELSPVTGLDAIRALEGATVDVVFLVASPESPTIREALRSPNVTLVSFPRAEAHTRIFRFLRQVILPQGTMDLAANVPASDTVLLGSTVNLVVRRDFHPALSNVLLTAASTVHAKPGLLEQSRQFPSPDGVDVPLSDEARRYYQSGPPFLIRYLPFWAATLADRLKILLLPLIAILLPLFKSVPPLYVWRVRSRIYRWYSDLDSVDRSLRDALPASAIPKLRQELDRIEGEVRNVVVPVSYGAEHYHLRQHIQFLRNKVIEAANASPTKEGRT